MPEPNPPRFRIRLDDGAELPVGSVEALARRVARGDVGPGTHLFDGSTGKWQAAGEAPVVQFILDELKREGRDLPPEWVAPPEERPDHALPVPPEPASESLPSSPAEALRTHKDPLDLKLTPASQAEDLGPALKNAFASPGSSGSGPVTHVPVPVERGDAPELPPRTSASRAREDEWLTSSSEGGLFAAAARSGVEEADAKPPSEVIAPPRRRRATREPERPWAVWFGLAVVGVIAVVGSGILLGDAGGDAEGFGPESPAIGVGSMPSPPAGLEAAAERAMDVLANAFVTSVDSARSSAGLAPAPPQEWLTGYYLANAAEFPEVRDYWDRYGALLEELRVLDRSVVAEVIESELGSSVVPANDRARLATYVEERYAAALPRRQEVYTQLSAVASAAIDLHDFLTESGDAIDYTPALGGQAIPRDPVLEVDADDPAVREGLETRLDAIFDALDRSRGGGAPPQSGLEEDLFGQFGAF